jgi:DNA-binding NarL/FixJ family response regulator
VSVRILLADDHKIVRDGLRALIERQPGLEVAGEAENGRAAVELTRQVSPDAVVMDVGMPDLNGIEATRQIVAEGAGVRVIALSMHSDRRFVTEMLRAGASGYLLKDCAFEELTQAVQVVMGGQTYLSPGIASVVVEDYVRQAGEEAVGLTGREREVLQLLAEGRSTKQIAERLRVSAKTVETHRQKLMEKLNLRSVADLTKYAVRAGLTSLER